MLPAHILIVTFPSQGQINPCLQLAKRFHQMGAVVTFATTLTAHRRITKNSESLAGINFAAFSDGYDDDSKPRNSFQHFMSELQIQSSQTLKKIIAENCTKGRIITCLVYSLFLPWAAEVARELQVPSALFWAQPASVFEIFHHYFNGEGAEITNHCNEPSWSIKLPGLPPLSVNDLPSFIVPSSSEKSAFSLQKFKEHFQILAVEENPTVLVNTFNDLEPGALSFMNGGNLKLISVGPLIPSVFLNGKDPSDTFYGGDLFKRPVEDCMKWLNSKSEGSVVYVSFGTILELEKEEMEEIANGLLATHRPFLWVIRKKCYGGGDDPYEYLSCSMDQRLRKQGMMVTWCCQLEVLTHPSVGCFVTHCGWNSTVESMAAGVPLVAVPRWVDQRTNAKMVEDVWEMGVRVKVEEEEGFVKGDEIRRCVEKVMGRDGKMMRKNVMKWKDLGKEALEEDYGSSFKNLKAFAN